MLRNNEVYIVYTLNTMIVTIMIVVVELNIRC